MVKGVNICDVKVLNNPAPFLDPFSFEITFACHEDLPDDIEWKIIYVGSAESEKLDQTLDSVLVGPVPAGKHMFTLEVPGPDPTRIPDQDVVGVTIVLITCSYREKEFIRVGYYVSNAYKDPEMHESPPEKPKYELLERNVLSTNARVTRFNIDWGDSETTTDSANGETATNNEEAQKNLETDFEIQNKENKQQPLVNMDCAQKTSNVQVLEENNELLSKMTTNPEKILSEDSSVVEVMDTNAAPVLAVE